MTNKPALTLDDMNEQLKNSMRKLLGPEPKTNQEAVHNPNHYQGANGLEVFEVLEQFAPCPEYLEGFLLVERGQVRP